MVRLDLGGVVGAARLDHVGVERPLDEEADARSLRRLLLENADELLADDLALTLGVGDPGQLGQEALFGVDVNEQDAEARMPPDLLGLVRAQKAVVDEDAG